jgi:hypothetical protein
MLRKYSSLTNEVLMIDKSCLINEIIYINVLVCLFFWWINPCLFKMTLVQHKPNSFWFI